jgi:hypothetical protein
MNARKNGQTAAVVAQVIALYGAGSTLAQCGQAAGVTRSGAWHIIRKAGIRRGRLPRVTDRQRADVVAAYRSGATLTAAAQAGRVSLYTAWAHLQAVDALRPSPFRKPPAMEATDTAAIAAGLAGGLTPWEVAKQLGRTLQQVLRVYRRNGCP